MNREICWRSPTSEMSVHAPLAACASCKLKKCRITAMQPASQRFWLAIDRSITRQRKRPNVAHIFGHSYALTPDTRHSSVLPFLGKPKIKCHLLIDPINAVRERARRATACCPCKNKKEMRIWLFCCGHDGCEHEEEGLHASGIQPLGSSP